MKKLSPLGVKILKMFHILFAFSWIVGASSMMLLSVLSNPQTGDELYMNARIIQIIDDYFVVGGAFGSLITGLIYSIFTNWGFAKKRWIAVKWCLTIVQMVFGTFVLGPFINGNVEIADKLRDAAFTDSEFISNAKGTLLWGSVQVFVLYLYIVISVQKPWKKKNAKAHQNSSLSRVP